MLEFPESFEAKPVCFTGLAAGMWGALRPVEQLQAIFSYRNAHILPQRVFLPIVNNLLTPEGEWHLLKGCPPCGGLPPTFIAAPTISKLAAGLSQGWILGALFDRAWFQSSWA